MATVSGVPIIGGITFNFTESGYTPPSASGTTYNFPGSSVLNQIWTDDNYVYAATSINLSVIGLISEEYEAYVTYSGGFTTVWGSDDKVYVGTSSDGIKYIYKTCVSGSIASPYNLNACLHSYRSPYGITAQNIRYIHGNDDKLMCCTTSGVDVYWSNFGYRSTATISGTRKCFMTSTGKFYYTKLSGHMWSLNRVNSHLWDWAAPDYRYIADGNGALASGISINDIFVTEDTSVSGNGYNTVFMATSSGVYVVDEGSLDYAIYYKEGV